MAPSIKLTIITCAVVTCTYCQSTPVIAPIELVAKSIPAPTIDLSQYPTPKALDKFERQGEITANGKSQTRSIMYQSNENEQVMTFSIYPLPGGWDTLNEKRQIAGHYGQVRQRFASRLAQQNLATITVINEQLTLQNNGNAVLAEATLRSSSTQTTSDHILMLRKSGNLFIHLTLSPAYEKDLQKARSAINRFADTINGSVPND